MEINTTALTQLSADKNYYLSNTTGTIKEAGWWQKLKCMTGLGDGRAKVQRLADAVRDALLADAFLKSEDKLTAELRDLDKTDSLSGASLSQIATRFKADHIKEVSTSDAYRVAESIADDQVAMWAKNGDILPEKKSMEYIKQLALYSAQHHADMAYDKYRDNPELMKRKMKSSMNSLIVALNSAENMKRKDVAYPKTDKCTLENGKTKNLNPPRFRIDELHFRAILGLMVTKDGPATFTEFTTALLKKLPEAELQKRKDIILDIKLEPPNIPGAGLAFASMVAKSRELYNTAILSGIKQASPEKFPADFANAGDEVVAEMRERFGSDAINEFCRAHTLTDWKKFKETIFPLVEAANAEGRTVNAEDVKAAIRPHCLRGAAVKVLHEKFKALATQMGLKSVDFSLVNHFAKANPAAIDEIAACNTPEAAREAADKYSGAISAKLQLHIDVENARKGLKAKAAEMIAEATGMSLEYVSARLNASKLLDSAIEVANAITTGKVKDADKPGFDVQAQFKNVLDSFVKSRLDALKEIDRLDDISDKLRAQWKSHVLSTYRAEKLNPSKVHKLVACGHFSDKQIVDALDAKGTAETAQKLCSYMGSINAHFVELFGADEWDGMGDDERDPVINMALMFVIDRNPAIAEKFVPRSDELMNARSNEFNDPKYISQGDGLKMVEGLYSIIVGEDGRKLGD